MPDYVERDEWETAGSGTLWTIILMLVGLAIFVVRFEWVVSRVEKLEQAVQSK